MKSSTSRYLRSFSPLWVPPTLFLLLFFFYPLIAILNLAVEQLVSVGWGIITWQDIWTPLRFTLWQACLSTLMTLAFGMPAAYVFAHYRFPGKRFLEVLLTLPFILPTVVVAAGFNALLGPRGWVNLFLNTISLPPVDLMNTLEIILIAHVFYNSTVVIRIVGSAWSQLDPRLEEAGRVLGASQLRTLWEVTLPLLKPTIFAATLLVFMFDFTSFGVILLLGGPNFSTLEVEIYTQALHLLNLPLAGLLSLVQMLFTLLMATIYASFHQKSSLALTPRLKGEGQRPPRNWKEILFILLVTATILLLLVSPTLALSARSFSRMEAERGQREEINQSITLDYYVELFTNRSESLFYVPPFSAMQNSLVYALLTIALAVPMGLMAAYSLNQRQLSARLLDLALLLPLGTSAVTLGLGYIIAFNRPPLNLASFTYLAPVAHSLVAFPFVVRTLQPAIAAIPSTYRQAAGTLGAPPWRIWFEIDLPITSRAILVSAIFAFTISLGEFGATILLARPEYPTIPLAIYRFISQPGALNYGQALAMSTLLMCVCGLCIYLMEQINREL